MKGELGERCEHADQPVVGLLRPLALLWLAGVMLRLTILALPPVLQAVEAEFRLQGFDIGVLTAIPALFFSLAAVPGALLIRRFGAVPTLLTGLLVNALGAAARGFAGSVIELELATSTMCLGVALMQPVMPSLVRTWMPARVGLATATYTCGLLCGEVLPAAWSLSPALPLVGDGWRATLFAWSIPVLATVPHHSHPATADRARAHRPRVEPVARLASGHSLEGRVCFSAPSTRPISASTDSCRVGFRDPEART